MIRLYGCAKKLCDIHNGKSWSLGNNNGQTSCRIATISRLLRADVRLAGLNHWIWLAARRAERGSSGGPSLDLVMDPRGLHAGAARVDVRGTGGYLPRRWRVCSISLLLAR